MHQGPIRSVCRLFALSLACVVGVQPPDVGQGGELFWSRRRARCGLHQGYAYGGDDARASAVVVAFAGAVDTTAVTWGIDERPKGQPWDLLPAPHQVNAKRFHVPVTALAVDHIQLQRIGVILYETGELRATALIEHNGGPNGDLIGNHVAIRLRALLGPRLPDDPLLDTVQIWSSEHSLWVRRGPSQSISLLPGPCCQHCQAQLRKHFWQITHVEIELEYRRDR